MILQPRRRRNIAAFSLLEVLVVVGVIALLITLFTLGFRHVSAANQADATKGALEQLKTMLTNYEKSISTGNASGGNYAGNPNPVPRALPWQAMLVAPGALTDGAADRQGGAVILTAVVMQLLQTVNENQTMLASMKTSQLMQPTINLANVSAWASGATPYFTGSLVSEGTAAYVSFQDTAGNVDPSTDFVDLLDGQAVPSPATGPYYWVKVYDSAKTPALRLSAPLLVDAWSNPILYVPPCGLLTTQAAPASTIYGAWAGGTIYSANAQVSDTVSVSGASVLQDFICVAGNTAAATWITGNEPPNSAYWRSAYSAPNGRPFWLSAGPDGVVGQVSATNSTPVDDNLTSYQN